LKKQGTPLKRRARYWAESTLVQDFSKVKVLKREKRHTRSSTRRREFPKMIELLKTKPVRRVFGVRNAEEECDAAGAQSNC